MFLTDCSHNRNKIKLEFWIQTILKCCETEACYYRGSRSHDLQSRWQNFLEGRVSSSRVWEIHASESFVFQIFLLCGTDVSCHTSGNVSSTFFQKGWWIMHISWVRSKRSFANTELKQRKTRLFASRATNWFCEKITQNVAQKNVLSKLIHKIVMWKK
jgi:hypothetical protein